MEKVSKYGDGSNNKELIITDKFGNVKSIFQKKISLTTIGTSGPSTFINNILNIPDYGGSLSGYVPNSRTLTINGTTYDLSANRTWNVGTVTSIATTGPITGGTITGSGTIGITQATTSTDGYLSSTDWNTFNNKQNAITLTTVGSSGPATLIGSTLNIPNYNAALTGYVPYVGATQNVNLGEFGLTAGQLTLDVSPTGTAVVGTTRWNNTIGSSETTLKGGSVILKNGVDLVARVVNKVTPNTTLTKAGYAAVRVSGAQGQRLAVAYAQANNDNNSADTIGLVAETIATNQEGFIITVGQLEEINTTGSLQGETWVDGDVLYLSPTTPGALTNVKPNGSTGHIVVIGYVEYAHANHGKIYVKIMNGWELDELHNVYINNPLSNQGIFYNSSNQLWENKSISTALGYTPVPTTRQLTINGTTYDLSANRTWSVGTVTAVTATGPLSSSGGTTPNITISQASGTDSGYLSSADWITFNSKQPAGNYITALSGEATGSGPGTASVTLNNASVTAKVLTGVNVTGGSINASDSILTAFGKLQNQINGLIGSSIYQGVWNASTNTPALTSGVGTRGYYYIVNVAGSTNLDGITDWNVGDWAIFDGTAWQQVDNTDSVTSVNGQTGAVSLTSDNIPEGVTNLYFTNLRARQALTLTTLGTSGAATYSNTTGILNIPQYQSVLTNPVTGTGTANYVARWISSSEISTGVLYDNGTNVGIGTNNPASKLTLQASNNTYALELRNSLGDTRGGFFYDNTSGANTSLFMQSSIGTDVVVLRTSGTSYLNGGNVGIGTTSPSAKLHVNGTFVSNALWTDNTSVGYWGAYSTAYGYLTWDTGFARIGAMPGNRLDFSTNGSTLAMTIATDGNVGIGTTAPANKLSISSGAFNNGATVASIINTSSTQKAHVVYDTFLIQQDDAPTLRLYETLENLSTTISSDAGLTSFATTGEMGLFVAGSSAAPGWTGLNGIQAIRINISGNIGIGTTLIPGNTTNKVLAIEGSDSANLLITETGGAAAAFTSFGNEAYIGTSTNHPFYMYTNGAERMRITNAGNVGIGTSSPSQKLTVEGRAFVDQFQYNQGIPISGVDLNDLSIAGFYAGSGLGNAPDSYGWYYVTVERHSDASWVHQTATSYGAGNTGNRIYSRTKEAGSWTGWKELSYTSNISGTTNYVSKFTSGNTIGNSLIYDNGTNVGIGTTFPSGKLDVSGTVITTSTLNSTAGSYAIDHPGINTWKIGVTSTNSSTLHIGNDTGGSFASKLLSITQAGNVGIGTTSPSSLLHIYGSGSTFTRYTNTSSSGHFIDVGANGTGESFVYSYGAYPLLFATDGNERMRIAANGDIRVGHTDNYGSRFSVKQPSSGSAANFSNGVDADLNVEITAVGAATKYAKLSPSVPVPLVLSIISGSNVGIGITNPSTKLHVVGVASIGQNTNGTAVIDAYSANAYYGCNTATNGITINPSGYVGIGTTNPSYRLDVAGDIHVQTSSLVGTVYFGNNAQNYLSYYNSDSYYRANGAHYFEGNGFYKGIWDANGFVGIGTTSPLRKLDVSGNHGDTTAILYASGSWGTASLDMWASEPNLSLEGSGIGNNVNSSPYFGRRTTAYGQSYLRFFLGEMMFSTGATTASEAMRIRTNGNVGIGTTNPSQKLTVDSGNIYVSQGGFIAYRTDGGTGLEVNGGDLGPGSFIARFRDYSNNDRVVINGIGNVGIGTTSPSQTLHVAGNARITGAYYDSNNQAGTSGQILSSTGSGTDWVDSPTSTATSVAQLLPSATVNYSWVGQVIDGTWVDIFTRANNVLTTGVWIVTMYVSDSGQGGNHYTYRYSGTMTWYQDVTNQTGLPAASEIALHRMGHAANNCILYLRTTEEAASDGGNGKLQINANYSNTSNTTITFTFVKII